MTNTVNGNNGRMINAATRIHEGSHPRGRDVERVVTALARARAMGESGIGETQRGSTSN
jgi:hypothetical protein